VSETGEWGHTLLPEEMSGDIAHALAEANAPRHSDTTPREWVKDNLFTNWYSGLFTIVFSTIALILTFLTARFVFATGQWEPVRANLELYMIGRFPRDERDRLVINLLLYAGAAGLGIGWTRARARDRADLAGISYVKSEPRDLLSSYWALAAFVLALMILGVRTIGPWLLLAGAIGSFVVGFGAAARAPRGLRAATLSLAGLAGVAGFLTLSGTRGFAWIFLTLALVPVMFDIIGRRTDGLPAATGWVAAVATMTVAGFLVVDRGIDLFIVIVIALGAVAFVASGIGNSATSVQIGSLAIAGIVTWQIGKALDVTNIDWIEWGGLYMNLVASVAAIVLAFPLGLLLALGRRSSLPVVRWMCTVYIEIIRGVPLITLLLMARFFLGFFLDTDNPLSLPTRAIAAITLFSAAYIAEIVRGGLQAVPRGQVEAGQALGLGAPAITRLLVLPQALRAVIPAMVGQFISLFKDTTLLFIIGVLEFLGVRDVVHSQAAFQNVGIAETLVFVAFGFWAISFTMSRESQRLERLLGIGTR